MPGENPEEFESGITSGSDDANGRRSLSVHIHNVNMNMTPPDVKLPTSVITGD